MSINGFCTAKWAVPYALTPVARLVLMALGDEAADYPDLGVVGVLDGTPEALVRRAATWASIADHEAQDGWDELLRLDLVYVDPDPRLGCWLTIMPRWEDTWASWVERIHPIEKVKVPARLREAVMLRDGRRCRRCGTGERLAIDHIHPASRGGLNAAQNLQVLCRSCNSAKGTRLVTA